MNGCASPHHGFTIMNRLSTENLVEPINKDLEFQLQDPFLLYRNANSDQFGEKSMKMSAFTTSVIYPSRLGVPPTVGIYSIWFYDKKDCQRIAQLMVKIVKQETLQGHRGSPERADVPGRTNGCSNDILELLSKAKDEFHRTQAGETEMSVTAEQRVNTETLKSAGDTTAHAHSASQPEQSSHSGQRQITVEELFGSSLPKEASLLPAMPTQSSTDPAATAPVSFLQAQSYAPPIPFQPLLTPRLTADPGGNNRHLTPGLISLMEARGSPGPGYTLYPVFPGGPSGDPQPQHSVSPLLVTPSGVEACGPPPGPLSAYLGKEPAYLKPSRSDLHKPALTPSVLPSPLATPQSFREPITKPAALGNMPTGRVQAVPVKAGLVVPGAGTSLTGAKHSILLSPSAFQHSVAKTTEMQRKAAPPSTPPAATGVVELPQPSYNRIQLQDTLIHLIKNDPVFLSAIHEAYLHSLSKDLSHVKL
ncbi:mRNA-decapping enzyme 1A-like isoform X3 [Oncorhynchus nerka]|uniref:mRNA-decapping enzyme 1A-like isoform X3 n=1 Tax=Oncorhynchus nerka TaxID=8023 RepID=UPI0031B8A273